MFLSITPHPESPRGYTRKRDCESEDVALCLLVFFRLAPLSLRFESVFRQRFKGQEGRRETINHTTIFRERMDRQHSCPLCSCRKSRRVEVEVEGASQESGWGIDEQIQRSWYHKTVNIFNFMVSPTIIVNLKHFSRKIK